MIYPYTSSTHFPVFIFWSSKKKDPTMDFYIHIIFP